MQPTDTVYFVHISDTHFGPTRDYARFGYYSYPCAQHLVEAINRLPVLPDFVIHTGDVVTHPNTAAYELAAETFARLRVPIYYVVGNHDTAVHIHHHLPMGPKQEYDNYPDRLSYTFTVKGHRFLVLDARGPDEIDPHGLFPESQLDLVRQEAQTDGPSVTVFLHYPIHPLNSTWMDANMLVLNGDAFHQALLPMRHRLRGVFYGHVHRPMQTMRDGIWYVAAASAFSQFTAWPGEEHVHLDAAYPPAFSFVHLLPQQTIVHQHIIPRPEGMPA